MERKAVSGLIVTLLFTSMLTSAFSIQQVEASEPPPTEWSETYGGAGYDFAVSVIQTSDGGYAMTGSTNSSGAGGFDVWLVKADWYGNELWSKTYGGVRNDLAMCVAETIDGGYVVAGYTVSSGAGGADFWLIKTNSYGNLQWSKTYGGSDNDYAYSVVQTVGGKYVIAGWTASLGAGSADFWLVKVDSSGNMQWSKTYGGPNPDYGRCVVQTADGGYVMTGRTASFGAGSTDFWLVKTDASGNLVWNRTYGGTGLDYALSVIQTSDGGYAMTGETNSFGAGGRDFWLVKTDSAGNIEWNKTYGGAASDYGRCVVQTADGGYAITGWTYSFGAGSADFWLVKVDSSGNMQWSKTYGGPNPDYGRCVVQTADGGYAITGGTYSFGAGDRDFWLVKVGTPSVPPSVPEFPLGLELMMALALAIPIVYLWRNRKMLGQC